MNIEFYEDSYVLVEGEVYKNEPKLRRVYLQIGKQEIDILEQLNADTREKFYEELLRLYDGEGGHSEDLKDREWEFD